ncbi:hypothetical protein M406DRAFT_39017 [Cryphonectria parasitica EP155]|uniref:FAM50A/XAP5 C-terminal domain-containing protein n=1 Tax=Cryphonectria parasitica (strain ATCC 38755 / EP155) TaxID=660469 RepID=A0A9P5CQH6_CRYP1|nr:uncharacterized protein M406DRAFT_39017 [Cryphonectria parasitica EP155]KAF3767238.1 hypothetical protein M406DRAFT_39017 [Cryphonectria parasitica EP155]
MSDTPPAQQQSRFKAPSNLTTSERLSTNTVGLVALSDFRKRRAEVLEQQEREAREALRSSGTNTPAGRSPVKRAKKGKAGKRALVSFGDDGEEEEEEMKETEKEKEKDKEADKEAREDSADPSADSDASGKKKPAKITANASVGIVPRALTKAALRREAAEREALRKEFLVLQEAVKNTEIAIPFVFYDGTNTPGGTVRVRKGEFVWVFLDKSRKVGAQLGIGSERNTNVRKEWARVGVDDLLLVRGTMIIPHQYEFYFFIMNKSVGPKNVRLFNYSTEPPPQERASIDDSDDTPPPANVLSKPKGGINKNLVDIKDLEGAGDDPTFTKVVDRRWYERNKHIYPASLWQEFDPEKDYTSDVRKDNGGNTFFFSR